MLHVQYDSSGTLTDNSPVGLTSSFRLAYVDPACSSAPHIGYDRPGGDMGNAYSAVSAVRRITLEGSLTTQLSYPLHCPLPECLRRVLLQHAPMHRLGVHGGRGVLPEEHPLSRSC